MNKALADEFTSWVEKYALKVNPPGCLPLPAQEREINLFARIVRALNGTEQMSSKRLSEIATDAEAIEWLNRAVAKGFAKAVVEQLQDAYELARTVTALTEPVQAVTDRIRTRAEKDPD